MFPPFHRCPVAAPSQFDIRVSRLLRFLLKAMQNVNRFLKTGHVENPLLRARVNSNFHCSRPYIRQEIRGRFATLDKLQLIANIRPSFSGKSADTIQCVSHPVEWRQSPKF